MTGEVTKDTVLVQRADRASATIDEVTAVMDPDDDIYLLIDAIGSEIWVRLAQPTRIGDILDGLLADYDVDAETCSRDVLAFANELVRRNMADIV